MIRLFPHKRSVWSQQDFTGNEDFRRWAYGGKGGGGAPPPPDPAVTSRFQGQQNRQTAVAQARLNQVNEYNPYGSSEYTARRDAQGNPVITYDQVAVLDAEGRPTYDAEGKAITAQGPGIQQFDRTTELHPEDQAQLDRERVIRADLTRMGGEQLERIDETVSKPFNYDGIEEIQKANPEERQRIEDALYQRHATRLDPRMQQEQQRLETQLANQGIQRGTDAWQRESQNFGRTKNDAYEQARTGAIQGGGAEMSRLHQMSMANRQQGIGEYHTLRDRPINELSALLGASPTVGQPTFAPIPTGGIAAPDYQGAVAQNYQGQLNAYNTRQQRGAANSSALAGLAGTGVMAGVGAASGFF